MMECHIVCTDVRVISPVLNEVSLNGYNFSSVGRITLIFWQLRERPASGCFWCSLTLSVTYFPSIPSDVDHCVLSGVDDFLACSSC